jgi:hypothetical protein
VHLLVIYKQNSSVGGIECAAKYDFPYAALIAEAVLTTTYAEHLVVLQHPSWNQWTRLHLNNAIAICFYTLPWACLSLGRRWVRLFLDSKYSVLSWFAEHTFQVWTQFSHDSIYHSKSSVCCHRVNCQGLTWFVPKILKRLVSVEK